MQAHWVQAAPPVAGVNAPNILQLEIIFRKVRVVQF
jgi:hypothetical protein